MIDYNALNGFKRKILIKMHKIAYNTKKTNMFFQFKTSIISFIDLVVERSILGNMSMVKLFAKDINDFVNNTFELADQINYLNSLNIQLSYIIQNIVRLDNLLNEMNFRCFLRVLELTVD